MDGNNYCSRNLKMDVTDAKVLKQPEFHNVPYLDQAFVEKKI